MLEPFQSEIQSASWLYNVPVSWISAVILAESSGDPMAYRYEPARKEASYGLMQLLESTARGLGFSGSADQLYLPSVNIDLGTRYLAGLRERWGDDLKAVYSAYNSGSGVNYQTNPTVAANVARVLGYAVQFAETNPGTTGGVGLLLVLALLWFWKRRKA